MGLLGDQAWKLLDGSEAVDNPRVSQLREAAKHYSVPNTEGVLTFHSKTTARSPDATIDNVNVSTEEVKEGIQKELDALREYVKGRKFYVLDRSVAMSRRFSLKVKAMVSTKYPHLALMFALNYFPAQEDATAEVLTIDIPEWPRKRIYVDPEDRVNIILGTDYYGELKMSALRLAMNSARSNGNMLGVHAGSKLYHLRIDGELRDRGILIFGLSGTGKSTVAMASHDLQPPEKATVRQDDIVILDKNAYASGTEMNFYPKTDSAEEIPALRKAVRHPEAILENVAVRDGHLDFNDTQFCPNARAIGIREAMEVADGRVDLPRVDALLFLMRRVDYPVASRLVSPEQAVAYYMLGESIRTAAEAGGKGEPIRVIGFDPFIIEPKSRNGQILLEILKVNPKVQAFVLNTGHVGGSKIPPSLTLSAVLGIVTERIRWSYSEDLRVDVAGEIGGTRLSDYDPSRVFGGDYARRLESLRSERRAYLQRFPGFDAVADAV